MGPPNTMSPRIYFPIYHRRTNRNRPCKLLPRHRPTRHVLRSCPFPLRPIYGRRIRHSSRIHPLIPTSHRIYLTPNMSKSPLRGNIHRSKPNVLSSTLPGPSRNTPTILGLPRRLHTMKHRVLHRLLNLNSSRNYTNIHHLRSLLSQTKSPTTRANRHKH